MSHFSVFVIGDNIEQQLQPYHEYECTGVKDEYVKFVPAKESMEEFKKTHTEHLEKYEDTPGGLAEFIPYWYDYEYREGVYGRETNPNSKWDWWVVGGRWSDFLKLKDGTRADHAKLIDVDLEGMREERGSAAAANYDKASSAIKEAGGSSRWKTWSQVREELSSIEDARKAYRSQAEVQAILGAFGDPFLQPDKFCCSREEYIQRARNTATTPYALVRDGRWIAKGEMGWWGMSNDDISQDDWDFKINEMLDQLPGETLITVVDCHI